jgi:hypothetical protein
MNRRTIVVDETSFYRHTLFVDEKHEDSNNMSRCSVHLCCRRDFHNRHSFRTRISAQFIPGQKQKNNYRTSGTSNELFMYLIFTGQVNHLVLAPVFRECLLRGYQTTITFCKKLVEFQLCHPGIRAGFQQLHQAGLPHTYTSRRGCTALLDNPFIDVCPNL